MRDFKRGGFGGNKKFGGRGGGRGGFRGGDRGPVEMHEAICSQCGNPCQVPFRPTSGKPIFCTNCFSGKKESDDRFPQKNYGGFRGANNPDYGRDRSEGSNNKIEKQLEILNGKIDRLIKITEEAAAGKTKKSDK